MSQGFPWLTTLPGTLRITGTKAHVVPATPRSVSRPEQSLGSSHGAAGEAYPLGPVSAAVSLRPPSSRAGLQSDPAAPATQHPTGWESRLGLIDGETARNQTRPLACSPPRGCSRDVWIGP
jgi:hypothetical protein